MKHKRLLIIGVVCASAGIAQIGGIVHDPINGVILNTQVGHMLTQIADMAKQLSQLKQSYDHQVFQAKAALGQLANWRYTLIPWRNTTAIDTAGTNAGWVGAINSGSGVIAGYEKVIGVLNNPASVVGFGSPDMQRRAAQRVGLMELGAGTDQHAMSVIGRLRAEEPQMRARIQSLSQASTSTNADDNTEAALLNKVNNASVLGLQNAMAANDLMAAHAELLLQAKAAERQAAIQALNMEIEFRTNGADALNRQTAGTSQALANMRLP